MNLCKVPTGINMQKPAIHFLKMRVPTGISMQYCVNCESYRHQHAMLTCVADLYVYDSLQYDSRVFAWAKKLSVFTRQKIRNIKKLKQKNASANLVRSKSKIQRGSSNETLILKHRCLASIVHSKLTTVTLCTTIFRSLKYSPTKFSQPANLNTPCLLYTSPSPRDRQKSRMPSSA